MTALYLDSADEETKLYQETIAEIWDEIDQAIDDAFPGGRQSMMGDATREQKWQRYLANTYASDLPLLMDLKYYDKYRRAEAPALVSPFWLNALSLERDFRDMQHEFRELARWAVGKVQEKRPVREEQAVSY